MSSEDRLVMHSVRLHQQEFDNPDISAVDKSPLPYGPAFYARNGKHYVALRSEPVFVEVESLVQWLKDHRPDLL